MTLSPILTVFVVTLIVLAHSTMAAFTYDKNGEATHCNGVPLPSIQTVEQARTETEKHLSTIKAEGARQAELAPNTHPSAEAVSSQEIFFTGKPYIEETAQYTFLFWNYGQELSCWSTTVSFKTYITSHIGIKLLVGPWAE